MHTRPHIHSQSGYLTKYMQCCCQVVNDCNLTEAPIVLPLTDKCGRMRSPPPSKLPLVGACILCAPAWLRAQTNLSYNTRAIQHLGNYSSTRDCSGYMYVCHVLKRSALGLLRVLRGRVTCAMSRADATTPPAQTTPRRMDSPQ